MYYLKCNIFGNVTLENMYELLVFKLVPPKQIFTEECDVSIFKTVGGVKWCGQSHFYYDYIKQGLLTKLKAKYHFGNNIDFGVNFLFPLTLIQYFFLVYFGKPSVKPILLKTVP